MSTARLMQALAAAATLGVSAAALSAPIPIDLNTWEKRGPAVNGTWTVAADGASVFQSVNGNPTFFVSPTNQINTTIRGSIRVETTGDDDFIGFVFGFNGPASTGNDMNFVLFDWKQLNQNSGGFLAQEGFALSRVNGIITNYVPGFWGHTDSAEFDVLATDFGSTRGWEDNVLYDFEIVYQTNRITIDIAGGAFGAGDTIFDIAGSFPNGRFGFYNYSQSSVRYAGLTEEETPPDPDGRVPEPSTLALLGIAALGFSVLRRRSKP